MTNPKSDLPQGKLDLLILRIVSPGPDSGPNYGYALAQRIRPISRDVLENRGLLNAECKETETGREAKLYRFTAQGRRQLKDETESRASLAGAVGRIPGTAGETE